MSEIAEKPVEIVPAKSEDKLEIEKEEQEKAITQKSVKSLQSTSEVWLMGAPSGLIANHSLLAERPKLCF